MPKIYKNFVPQFSILSAVNKVECNPLFQQKEFRKIMDEDGVKLEAWYPLGHGDPGLVKEEVFGKLADKYRKSNAQVVLRTGNSRDRSSCALKFRKDLSRCLSRRIPRELPAI